MSSSSACPISRTCRSGCAATKKRWPKRRAIKITRVVDIQGDPRIAFDTATQIVGKERDKVDAFVCLEAQSGKEVAGVLNSYHVTGKVVIAMDTDQETLDWIQKGVIAATIAQKPYTMAFVGMQMLDNLVSSQAAIAGYGLVQGQLLRRSPASWIQVPALIDKSNVDAFMQAGKNLSSAPK